MSSSVGSVAPPNSPAFPTPSPPTFPLIPLPSQWNPVGYGLPLMHANPLQIFYRSFFTTTSPSINPYTLPPPDTLLNAPVSSVPPKAVQTPQKKRRPARFSDAQVAAMEERFKRDAFLKTAERAALAQQIGLAPIQVRRWFQDRRRRGAPSIDKLTHSQ